MVNPYRPQPPPADLDDATPPSSPLPPLTPSPPVLHPARPPRSRCPHSGSSDSESFPSTPRFTMAPVDQYIASLPYAPATVLQSSTSQPPLLSAGSITVSNLRKFDYGCKCFFTYKEIPTEDQVTCIIYSFESEFMQSWIESDSARLISLSFSEFMLEIKCKWLPSDWEDELIQELIIPQGEQEFYEWSVSVCKANNELDAARSLQHIPDERFHVHLVAHLKPALHLAYRAGKKELDAIEDIELWIHCIMILDLQLTTQQQHISSSMAHAAKTAAKLFQITQHPTYAHTATPPPPATIPTTSATLFARFIALPKLTQTERDLLDQHQGCYKCQTFYAGHFSCSCSNKRPTLDTCKKVTATHALHAKTAFEAHVASVIGAVFGAGLQEDYVDTDFMDSDEFDEYVDPLPSFLLPDHLWWNCCIDAPFMCAPSPIHTLIDHGATPVLISEDTVELYGLVPHKLFRPFSVSATFVSGRPKAKPVVLSHYCRLDLITPNAQWKSHTLNAIICPNLQTDIILGLDFLVKNKIVVDTELCTAIAKDCGFDLLNLPVVSSLPLPKISPAVRQR
jgi:hypothetical protein